ncbi:MAG: hypothetical protein MHM6MM_003640 [Cercozoa sp. M6MM]
MSVRAEFLATTRRSVADALRALGSRITEGEAKLLGGLDARLSRFLVDFERLERHADVASARPDSNSEERELWHILLKMELLRLDELFDTAVERQAQMLVVHFREVRRCNAMLIRRAIERFRPLEDKGDNVGVAGSATDQTKAQFDWTAFFVQILRRPAFSSDRIARHVMQQKMQKDSFQCSCVYCKVEPARSPVLLPCAHLSCKACLGDTPSVLECPSCKCVFAWSAVPAVDPIVDSHIRSLVCFRFPRTGSLCAVLVGTCSSRTPRDRKSLLPRLPKWTPQRVKAALFSRSVRQLQSRQRNLMSHRNKPVRSSSLKCSCWSERFWQRQRRADQRSLRMPRSRVTSARSRVFGRRRTCCFVPPMCLVQRAHVLAEKSTAVGVCSSTTRATKSTN